jgi:hypothetical protein
MPTVANTSLIEWAGKQHMDPQRLDRLAKGLARHLPRRGLLGGISLAGIGTLIGARASWAQSGESEHRTAQVACRPCHCDDNGENCECCLNGVTGGGVVRTEVGDATLVLFATELGDEAERQATGFVRWIDPVTDGGMTLESVGPISYQWELENELAREIRGTMAVNGEGEEPFVLLLTVSEAEQPGSDLASLEVGDLTGGGFGYVTSGQIIGGGLQLLDTIAPVA